MSDMNLDEYMAQVRTHGKEANQLMDEIELDFQKINAVINQKHKQNFFQRAINIIKTIFKISD